MSKYEKKVITDAIDHLYCEIKQSEKLPAEKKAEMQKMCIYLCTMIDNNKI